MKKYRYKAWSDDFKVVKGIIEGDDIDDATEKLKDKGLKLIDINKTINLSEIKFGRKTLKESEIAGYCGQMGIIINAGVSIITGLEVIKEQNKDLVKIIDLVLGGVKKGESLGVSMQKTEVFPKLLTDMIMTGELSGNVDEIFFNMESFYEREASIKSKIKGASVYPIMVLCVTFAMIAFFNFFMFPNLKTMFSDNKELPFITVAFLGLMNFLNSHFFVVPVVIILIILLIKYLKRIPKVRMYFDLLSLRLPQIGKVRRDIITSRFSRSMAIFLRSAVPLLSALDNIQMIIGNYYLYEKIGTAKGEIINGARIADSLDEQKIFDPLVIQMIRIGEETGKIEDMLFKLADIYDKRAEQGINKMMTLIEPAFTLIIGVLVGFVVIAMGLPILNMSNSIK